MLKENLVNHKFLKFNVNPYIKTYIVGEALIWSGWNFAMPIIAIYIVNNIKGANIETAATSYSMFLISRVFFELISGKYLTHTSNNKKLLVSIGGMICMSLAYLGFSYADRITEVFVFYIILGLGLGISTPAKSALFSSHLDKNKETVEWGISDAIQLLCMALSAAVGGLIAHQYGFGALFIISAVINLLGIIPYIFNHDFRRIN